jgi:Putative polyhydroxyalkanoic acid system protein (PHA_gran_rgn)
MPKIHLSVPHALDPEEAKKRIANLLADSRAKFGGQVTDVTEAWAGCVDTFSFRALGFSVAGKLEVQAGQLLVDIDLPFAALPFKGRVESEILSHARQLLA